MRLYKAIVYSNLWIALCAAICALQSYWLKGISIQWNICAILFFATLARYNIICFTMPKTVIGEKFRFMQRHAWWLKTVFFISTMLCALLMFTLDWVEILFLGHLGFITFWYLFPLPLGFRKLKPLRRMPFLKIFLIAYVWSAGVYMLPLIHEKWDLQTWLGFFERLLFLFAITIPFDIKDLEDDMKMQLKTIPSQIGINRAKGLASLCLILSVICAYFAFGISNTLPLLGGYLVAFSLNLGITPNRKEIYYLGHIDGTMIFQAFLFSLWHYL